MQIEDITAHNLPHLKYNASVGYYCIAHQQSEDFHLFALAFCVCPLDQEEQFLRRLINSDLLEYLKKSPACLFPLESQDQIVGVPLAYGLDEIDFNADMADFPPAVQQIEKLAKELNERVLGWK